MISADFSDKNYGRTKIIGGVAGLLPKLASELERGFKVWCTVSELFAVNNMRDIDVVWMMNDI